MDDEPLYLIRRAGMGFVLNARVHGRRVERFLDRERGMLIDGSELPGAPGVGRLLLIRPGRWLVLLEDRWHALDPHPRAHAPLAGVRPADRLGPCVSDGRVLLLSADRLWLLDPDSSERMPITVGCEGTPYSLKDWDVPGLLSPPGEPTFVSFACRPHRRGDSVPTFSGLGLLDIQALTLTPVVADGDGPTRLLHARGRQAIVLESSTRLVRYDVEKGTSEVLFSLDDVR